MSNGDKAEWLREHLFYEVQMMRFAFGAMGALPAGFEWNVCQVAFVVHARNLYYFLRNNAGTNNFQASDFITGGYKPNKNINTTKTPMGQMEAEVLHTGEDRYVGAHPDKFDTIKAGKVYDWLEDELMTFIKQLQGDYADAWKSRSADLLPRLVKMNIEAPITPQQSGNPLLFPDRGTMTASYPAVRVSTPGWAPDSVWRRDPK